MPKRSTYTEGFLVRLSPADKKLFSRQAERAGISLSDAMREGTREYLARLTGPQAPQDDELLAEFKALGAQLEARFRP